MIVCGMNYFATGWRDVIISKTLIGAGKKVRKQSSQNCNGEDQKDFQAEKRKSQIDCAVFFFQMHQKEKKSGDIKSDGPFDTVENGSGKDI